MISVFGISGVERRCAGCCLEALSGGALVTLFLEVRCVLADRYVNWKDDGTILCWSLCVEL